MSDMKPTKVAKPIVISEKKGKSVPTKNTTVVQACKNKCVSPDQDKMYGNGKRVMNSMANRSAAGGFRCTVCRTVN